MEGRFLTNKKNKIINVISNYNPASQKTYQLLIDKLKSKGFVVPNKYDDNAELNICIGGDGAFFTNCT